MAVGTLRSRTQDILKHHEEEMCRISGGSPPNALEQVVRLEGLLQETVRLLRENKTHCVRQEQAAANEFSQLIPDSNGELEFDKVKVEIDHAISEILQDRADLRMKRDSLTATSNSTDRDTGTLSTDKIAVVEKIERLAELYGSGVLTQDEFALAKSQLL